MHLDEWLAAFEEGVLRGDASDGKARRIYDVGVDRLCGLMDELEDRALEIGGEGDDLDAEWRVVPARAN